MKLEIIAPVEGKSWIVGHTVLIEDTKVVHKLISNGFAIHHPSVTNPPPTHECPCKEHDEPCEKCDEEKEKISPPKKKVKRKKTTPLKT